MDRYGIQLDLAAADMVKQLRNASAVTTELNTDLEDTRTAGRRAADALKRVADEASADLRRSTDAAHALAKAMGDDTVQAFQRSGRSVADIITTLRQAGLSFEDITTDADALGDALRHVNQVGDQIDNSVTKNLRHTADTADKATNSLHSFAGNVAGDIAATAASFGPLGEGIGQLTEGLLAGQTGFKNLALAAGGMGVIALVINSITNATAEAERRTKQLKDAHEALTAGRLEYAARDIIDAYSGLYTTAARAGVSVQDLTRSLLGNEAATKRIFTAMERHAEQLQGNHREQVKYNQATVAFTSAWQFARRDWEESGDAAKYNAETLYDVGTALGIVRPGLGAVAEKAATLAEATERLNTAWSAYYDLLDKQDLAERAWKSFGDANLSINERKRLMGEYVQTVLGFPPDAMNRFNLYIDQGELDKAAHLLHLFDEIALRQRGANWFDQRTNSTTAGQMRGFASGTQSAPAGAHVVGEKAPEIVQFRGGESVTTLDQLIGSRSPAMVDQSVTHIYLPAGADPDRYDAERRRSLRRNGPGI